jgi:D-glucosaminate-6-phosphate ammonia-lyase
VKTDIIEPSGVVRVPALRVKWDPARIHLDGMGVRRRLLEGSPRVMIDDNAAIADSITLDPFQLEPGQAIEVGRAVATVLNAARAIAVEPAAAPAADLSGDWEVRVQFLHGERKHRVTLRQQGSALAGNQHSAQFDGAVAGSLQANRVRMTFTTRYEGAIIAYQLEGEVANGRMGGTATLGGGTDGHAGPVNLAQFGAGAWQAVRLT